MGVLAAKIIIEDMFKAIGLIFKLIGVAFYGLFLLLKLIFEKLIKPFYFKMIHPHILKNIKDFIEAAEIVLCHHENYDGNGYPRGLRGAQIPIGARILAIVTDFCAMISERPYRKALTTEEALFEMKLKSNGRYDTELLEIFIQMIEEKHNKNLDIYNEGSII